MSRGTVIRQSHDTASGGVRKFDVGRSWDLYQGVHRMEATFATIREIGRELSINRQIYIAFPHTFRNYAEGERTYRTPCISLTIESISGTVANGEGATRPSLA
jgi:hypothetical protein